LGHLDVVGGKLRQPRPDARVLHMDVGHWRACGLLYADHRWWRPEPQSRTLHSVAARPNQPMKLTGGHGGGFEVGGCHKPPAAYRRRSSTGVAIDTFRAAGVET